MFLAQRGSIDRISFAFGMLVNTVCSVFQKRRPYNPILCCIIVSYVRTWRFLSEERVIGVGTETGPWIKPSGEDSSQGSNLISSDRIEYVEMGRNCWIRYLFIPEQLHYMY